MASRELPTMILHVVDVEALDACRLRVAFNDGTCKCVDLKPLLHGPVFEPLRDPAYFAQVKLDPACGVVFWPNGADLAPEALHDLEPVREPGR
jgi:hypothetical protein